MSSRSRVLWIGLALLPMLFFAALRLNPQLDMEFAAPLFHFYIVTFTAFAALVSGLFVASAVEQSRHLYIQFFTMGFVSIAGIFLLHGLATPGVVMQGFNHAVGWSSRFSLLSGGVLFGLASLRWPPKLEARLLARRGSLWVGLALLYVAYTVVAFGYPEPLAGLSTLEPGIDFGLGALATLLYLWAAWVGWRRYRRAESNLRLALTIALVLLAEAQVSMVLGPLWALSWWLYHVLMLVGFVLAVGAIAAEYEALSDFRATRYFSALGGIISLGLAFVSGEVAVTLVGDPRARLPFLAITLSVTSALFVALFFVVRRADQLLRERTEALRREQKMRSDFTRLVVHDLKNPLSAVIANLSALKSGMVGTLDDQQERFLDRGLSSAQDIKGLLEDMLDYERLEGGVLTPQLEEVSLSRLIQERVWAVEGLIQQNHQELDMEIDQNLPPVQVDQDLVSRVLDNLLSNAVKFSGEGGRIRVRSGGENGSVLIDILDNGPGVPESDRARIFDRFYRGNNVRERGAGLGLAFCQMVVEAHGGDIWVDDAPGGGAAFHVQLPLNGGAND
ncbi:MAG: ATP-binding protein [Anaerolineales bacterium]|nr:ATP-binding protein [Anaerolineales bacterium]